MSLPRINLRRKSKEMAEMEPLPEDVKPVLFSEVQPSATDSIFDKISVHPGMGNKEYWKKATDYVEDEIYCKSIPKVPLLDFSVVLPPKLKARVKNILSYDYSEYDELVYIEDQLAENVGKKYKEEYTEDEEPLGKKVLELRKRGSEKSFHESLYSEIERMEREFVDIAILVDEPLRHSVLQVDDRNWMSHYVCNPDRVTWNSISCKKVTNKAELKLDEQAEQLMEMAAERFVEWLETIGSGEDIISVENLKDLFSIKGDITLLSSFTSNPKEVNAIAKTVADKWNKPDIAIETQYEDHIKYRVKQVPPKKKMLSAFGRTIPGPNRPWYKSATDVPIETVYPKELLTREKIFNGIRHLRSVRALIEFYLKHPRLPRPEYLVKNGDFKLDVHKSVDSDTPLYEKLGLKY